MKTRIIHLAALFALILLVPALLHAQMAIKQPLMRVDIPFAFVAGGVHRPAGQYHVHHPGNPYLIVIEKSDGPARAMLFVQPWTTDAHTSSTKLVFNKYGDQYFSVPGLDYPDRQVHHCFKCQMEKASMAQVPKPEAVVLAAKR